MISAFYSFFERFERNALIIYSLLTPGSQNDTQLFYSTKLTRPYYVHPLFDISISAEPSQTFDHSYVVNADIMNVSATAEAEIVQISCLSPLWMARPLAETNL